MNCIPQEWMKEISTCMKALQNDVTQNLSTLSQFRREIESIKSDIAFARSPSHTPFSSHSTLSVDAYNQATTPPPPSLLLQSYNQQLSHIQQHISQPQPISLTQSHISQTQQSTKKKKTFEELMANSNTWYFGYRCWKQRS